MMIKKHETIIARKARTAESFFDRLIGLMFSKEMGEFDGLLLKSCRSIHTFFMNYPIDAIFLNDEMEVIHIVRNMRPWRITGFYFKASQVLEIKGGTLPDHILKGDRVEVSMYKLVVVGGKLRGQEFVLEEGESILGREADCEIPLPIGGISKQHASITVSGDSCYIKDLDSINGTFVNGQFIKNTILKDKDRIALPDTIIQIVYVIEKKKIVKKRVTSEDDAEEVFYKGGSPPKNLFGKILHLFKYKAMSALHGMNEEWEWKILTALLLSIFSLTVVALVIYPVLQKSKSILLMETAKRGSHYADEISRLNSQALERKQFSSLNTKFLDGEEGVTSYELFDLQGRIVRPLSKLNEYIQDTFSNEAKSWAEETFGREGSVTYKKLLSAGRIGIAQKILAYDPKIQKRIPVGVIAIIFEPTSLKLEAVENSKAYLEAIVTVGLVGILFYGVLYFLSLRPIDEMKFQLEEALRGRRKNLEGRYLMEELGPLREAVNALLQRVRELSNEESDEQDLEEDTSYVNSLKEFMQGSGVPTIILDSGKNLQAINPEAEDITGIRQSSSEGVNFLDVSREKGFSATVLELCENSANNDGTNQQGEYELSGVNFSVHVSALIGKDNFAKAFYITFLREA